MNGMRLKEFLKSVRKELEMYDEEVRRENKKIIAFLEELVVTVQVSSITSAKGAVNIVIANLGGEQALGSTHTITLKFVLPKHESFGLLGQTSLRSEE